MKKRPWAELLYIIFCLLSISFAVDVQTYVYPLVNGSVLSGSEGFIQVFVKYASGDVKVCLVPCNLMEEPRIKVCKEIRNIEYGSTWTESRPLLFYFKLKDKEGFCNYTIEVGNKNFDYIFKVKKKGVLFYELFTKNVKPGWNKLIFTLWSNKELYNCKILFGADNIIFSLNPYFVGKLNSTKKYVKETIFVKNSDHGVNIINATVECYNIFGELEKYIFNLVLSTTDQNLVRFYVKPNYIYINKTNYVEIKLYSKYKLDYICFYLNSSRNILLGGEYCLFGVDRNITVKLPIFFRAPEDVNLLYRFSYENKEYSGKIKIPIIFIGHKSVNVILKDIQCRNNLCILKLAVVNTGNVALENIFVKIKKTDTIIPLTESYFIQHLLPKSSKEIVMKVYLLSKEIDNLFIEIQYDGKTEVFSKNIGGILQIISYNKNFAVNYVFSLVIFVILISILIIRSRLQILGRR